MVNVVLLWGVLGLCPMQAEEPSSPPADAGKPAAQTEDAPPPDAGPPILPGLKLEDIELDLKKKLDPGSLPPAVQRTEVDGLPTDKLGDEMPMMHPFTVPDIVRNARDYAGTKVVIKGLARRTCSTGCWLEVAEVPSAREYVRIVPGPGILMFSSSSPRRITAYGEFKRVKRSAAEAAKMDAEAVQVGRARHKTPAGDEWVLVAESLVIQWLD